MAGRRWALRATFPLPQSLPKYRRAFRLQHRPIMQTFSTYLAFNTRRRKTNQKHCSQFALANRYFLLVGGKRAEIMIADNFGINKNIFSKKSVATTIRPNVGASASRSSGRALAKKNSGAPSASHKRAYLPHKPHAPSSSSLSLTATAAAAVAATAAANRRQCRQQLRPRRPTADGGRLRSLECANKAADEQRRAKADASRTRLPSGL